MNRFILKEMIIFFSLVMLLGIQSCSNEKEEPVGPIEVSAISVNPPAVSLKVGESTELSVAVTPSDAADKTIVWTTSDAKIASVDNGKVSALAAGTANITATSKSGNKTSVCVVTVGQETEVSVEDVLEGNITADRTILAANKNFLKGFVYVKSGATLTIEAGAVIKGKSVKAGEKAASLIIEPGARIIAVGTAEKPIVFTSDKSAGERNTGDWGGLVICGNARVNQTKRPVVEGGPGTAYGNTTSDDGNTESSGKLKYVRLEFAGYPLEPDKEINALTLAGVGNGTEIEFVQVSYANDDSYEWFGGTVNAKHLIAYKGWDDDFDTDNGYSGMLQFLLSIRDRNFADTSDSNGFESDNDGSGSSNTPLTKPVFSNVTLIGPFYGKVSDMQKSEVESTTADAVSGAKGGKYQAAIHLRRNSALNIYNSVFTGWPYGVRATDKKGSANEAAVLKNIVFAGMWKNFYDDGQKSELFFNREKNKQVLFESTRDVFAKDGDFSSVIPQAVQGAEFADAVLNNAFFEKVAYKGAFDGKNDWTEGWTNWDPQNTVY